MERMRKEKRGDKSRQGRRAENRRVMGDNVPVVISLSSVKGKHEGMKDTKTRQIKSWSGQKIIKHSRLNIAIH